MTSAAMKILKAAHKTAKRVLGMKKTRKARKARKSRAGKKTRRTGGMMYEFY